MQAPLLPLAGQEAARQTIGKPGLAEHEHLRGSRQLNSRVRCTDFEWQTQVVLCCLTCLMLDMNSKLVISQGSFACSNI